MQSQTLKQYVRSLQFQERNNSISPFPSAYEKPLADFFVIVGFPRGNILRDAMHRSIGH